jgi:hypothetical protein
MPFLAVLHLRPLVCPVCGIAVADPGSRSFVVNADGSPAAFQEDHLPERMTVAVRCSNGHVIERAVPDDVSAEETLTTPEDAPIGPDAVLKEN